MQINQAQFAAVVETAKAKAANHPEWLRSIEKAARLILSGELIVTPLAYGALVTSSNGTYATGATCSCKAARHNRANCYHKAAARLIDLYEEALLAEAAAKRCEVIIADIKAIAADIQASPRQHLIIEIENLWNRVEPTVALADALVARFGKNQLSMLPTEILKDIRLALAA